MNFVSVSRGQTGALDALLAGYAAGALSHPQHVLVASHLALKADNRAFVASLERLAATELEQSEAAPVANRSRRLADIFMSEDDQRAERDGTAFLPEPLARFIAMPYETLPWRSVIPGLKEVQFDHRPGCEASMLWIRAGRAMPAHTHPGIEATLVLKGSFQDSTGCYERGDISVVDSDVDHKPVAGSDEDCICFAVSDGPARLTGPIARLFQKLARH